MDYTVTLTEAENKAMEYIVASPQDWIDNAAHNRARKGIDEICRSIQIINLIETRQSLLLEKMLWFLLLFLRESCYQHLREQ